MEPDERDEVLRRLEAIEQALSLQEQRIQMLEGQIMPRSSGVFNRPSSAQGPPVPPHVPKYPRTSTPRYRPISTEAITAAPTKDTEDTEYRIGAQFLPRIGGFVVIVALAYLVSLAVGRGLITPPMLWWGANFLALLFVGVGQWKRNEREQFGSILTAVGSCGFYLNFAAGHVFQKLYPAETLVAMFFGLGLVNLAYAYWRSTQPFLVLGLFGGLVAALMPLQRHGYVTETLLTFLILVPATLISARNRWRWHSLLIWAAGTCSLIPIAIETTAPDGLRVSAILLVGLLTIGGMAASLGAERDRDIEPNLAVAALANGIIAFLCLRNPAGALAMLLYTAGLVLVSRIAKAKEAQTMLLGAAGFCVAVIAPFGFWNWPAPHAVGATVWIFVVEAVGFGIASIRFSRMVCAVMAVACTGLALVVYAGLFGPNPTFRFESAVIVGLLAAINVSAWSVKHSLRPGSALYIDQPFAVAALFDAGFVSRLGFLELTQAGVGWRETVSVSTMTMACAIVLFSVARASRQLSILVVGLGFLGIAGLSYVGAYSSNETSYVGGLLLMAVFSGAVIYAATTDTILRGRHPETPVIAAAVLWISISQLGYQLLSASSLAMQYNATLTATWVLFALGLLTCGFTWKVRELRFASFAVLGVTVGKVFLVDLADLDAGIRVAVLMLLGLALIGGGYAYIRLQRQSRSNAPEV